MSESLAWTPQPHPQLHPQKDEGRFVPTKVPLIVLKHLWPTDGMGGGGSARESKISSLDGWQTT